MEEQDRSQSNNETFYSRLSVDTTIQQRDSLQSSLRRILQTDNTNDGSGSYYKYAYIPFKYLFSKMYEHAMWIMGFKWYTILFVVVIGLFTFVLAESIIEQRTEHRKLKKEGMEALHPSTINENGKTKSTKKVSFEMDKSDTFYSRTREMFIQLYSLLILPTVYALFRTFGIR